jgi:4a-hydroxytetrahydrobiopterin dehydratase
MSGSYLETSSYLGDDWTTRRAGTVTCMAVLSDEEVDAALSDLTDWERVDNALRRSVKFPAFLDGIEAVRHIADRAEAADHHPDIDIRWRTVTFVLSTHSEGGITKNDLALAKEIDGIVGQ